MKPTIPIKPNLLGQPFIELDGTLKRGGLPVDKLKIGKSFKTDIRETEIQSGQKIRISQVVSGDSTTYPLKINDYIVGISDVVVSRTVTLPQPSLAGFGKIYVIKDMSGSAASTTITISPYSTEYIDHDTADGIGTNYGVKRYFTDGTNWFSW